MIATASGLLAASVRATLQSGSTLSARPVGNSRRNRSSDPTITRAVARKAAATGRLRSTPRISSAAANPHTTAINAAPRAGERVEAEGAGRLAILPLFGRAQGRVKLLTG
ncbi:hypothetical protein MGWOODY_Smn2326 [hydrothermal vent metagenome]|uniref:Uncharacterized protein n=1 Tax=hydrothermal vent metagenome TaxID=652676 RepID=A0A160TP04_9ZZZZ